MGYRYTPFCSRNLCNSVGCHSDLNFYGCPHIADIEWFEWLPTFISHATSLNLFHAALGILLYRLFISSHPGKLCCLWWYQNDSHIHVNICIASHGEIVRTHQHVNAVPSYASPRIPGHHLRHKFVASSHHLLAPNTINTILSDAWFVSKCMIDFVRKQQRTSSISQCKRLDIALCPLGSRNRHFDERTTRIQSSHHVATGFPCGKPRSSKARRNIVWAVISMKLIPPWS